MYLQADLAAKEETNAILIDRSLVNDRNEIFVVKDSTLRTLAVDPVYFSDKKAVIKGVPDGEVILSRTVSGAYDGMLVKIANASGTTSDPTEQESSNTTSPSSTTTENQ